MTSGTVNAALAGRLAVVTGSTRGIGAAIALRVRAIGARVIATGRASAGAAPQGCEYRSVDFADEAATTAFAQALATERPDILVNNAGINRLAPFAELAADTLSALHRVNVLAPMRLCQAVLPGMRARRWGRIVNIASIWSLRSISGRAAYSASKFGLDGLTAAIAAEVAADNVLVNCVSPGFVDTELLRTMNSAEQIDALIAQVSMRRLAKPEEIAAFVAWLVGAENTYISGQNLPIDGGYTRT
jgi:3-oxoacyl-[acyl-carrier protein] reductase